MTAAVSTCKATVAQQQGSSPCTAGTSFGCFDGAPTTTCTLWVGSGCRGEFHLTCASMRANAVAHTLACGFPGQARSERLNCSIGDQIIRKRQQSLRTVGRATRPEVGTSEKSPPPVQVHSLAICLHGKIGTWIRSGTQLHEDRHASSRTRGAADAVAIARIGATSILERVMNPSRRHGIDVTAFVHSWSPEVESTLDAIISPRASQYEPLIHTDRVLSQHLSIKRVLALMDSAEPSSSHTPASSKHATATASSERAAASSERTEYDTTHTLRRHVQRAAVSSSTPRSRTAGFDLVLLTRIDILFYSNLRVWSLPEYTSSRLWLPEYCQARHHGLAAERPPVRDAANQVCARSCFGAQCDPLPKARGARLFPAVFAERPTAQRLGGSMLFGGLDTHMSLGTVVNDFWYLATPPVARSFVWIYDAHQSYMRELSASLLSATDPQRKLTIPRFTHLFWAHHIRAVLAPRGVLSAFIASDYSLVRGGDAGTSCSVPFNDTWHSAGGTAASTRLISERRALRAFWRDTNASEWMVPKQCPLSWHLLEVVRCPWDSPACTLFAGHEWQERVGRAVKACVAARGLAEG